MLIVGHHREGPFIARPFDHRQHVRFAWSVLGENPGLPGEAIVADEIREFADIAAPGRHHETLTRFWLRLSSTPLSTLAARTTSTNCCSSSRPPRQDGAAAPLELGRALVEQGEGRLLGAKSRSAPTTGQRIWRGVTHRVHTVRPKASNLYRRAVRCAWSGIRRRRSERTFWAVTSSGITRGMLSQSPCVGTCSTGPLVVPVVAVVVVSRRGVPYRRGGGLPVVQRGTQP
jgi:hypothetical protein